MTANICVKFMLCHTVSVDEGVRVCSGLFPLQHSLFRKRRLQGSVRVALKG